jgi:hypothetical protein
MQFFEKVYYYYQECEYAENRVVSDLKKRDPNQDKKLTGMRNVVALGFVKRI